MREKIPSFLNSTLQQPPKAVAPAAPAPKKIVSNNSAAISAKSTSTAKAANEPLKFAFTQEEAEARLEGIVPSTITAELSSSNWKARLAAMEELQTWLDSGGLNTVEAELICRMFVKRPGWKESNFQVTLVPSLRHCLPLVSEATGTRSLRKFSASPSFSQRALLPGRKAALL